MAEEAADVVPADIVADEIELDFVPDPRATVVAQEFDGELLLVDSENGGSHVLNPVGSIVWQCFDAEGSLDDVIQDLAEGFGVSADEVRDQVLELARAVGRAGLLQGVAPARAPEPSVATPTGLGVGAELVPFALPGLDGSPVDLADLRGRPLLLVNWSPFCGYCAMIAADLAGMGDAFAERGLELVLLSMGEPEANRSLLEAHGLGATVLLRDGVGEGFRDPFPDMGTPIAYLIDTDGRVALPVATGAFEVPALARKAAGLPEREAAPPEELAQHDHNHEQDHEHESDHGHESDEGTVVEAPPGPKYLKTGAGSGMCNPGSASKAAREWATTSAYAVGDFHIGVRSDSDSTDAILGKVFAAHRLPDGTNVPDNFSVVLGEAGKRGARGLNLLLRGSTTVVRSRSPRRVLRALAAHLSALTDGEREGAPARTTNAAALVGGEAVLLPGALVEWLEQVQPRLARMGVRLVDEPFATVDVPGQALVVPEPRIEVDESALAAIDEPGPSRAELPAVEPGRYPLKAWALWVGADTRDEFTPARAVAAGMSTIVAKHKDFENLVPELKGLFEQVLALPIVFENADGLVSTLERSFADLA